MRSAVNQLVLLGLICQGLSQDLIAIPFVYALAWALVLLFVRSEIRLKPWVECGLIVMGSLFGIALGTVASQTTHFFIGHGLAWLQLARLARNLDRREKVFAIVISIFHLGVACTVVLDLRFILIAIFMIPLLARAFIEIERDGFLAGTLQRGRPRVGPLSYAVLLAVTVLFFLFFPRGFMASPFKNPRLGSTDSGTMADSMMDPTRGASSQGNRVLMQILGGNIGYLRCFSLTQTDGVKWWAPYRSPMLRIPPPAPERAAKLIPRRARVKNATFLGRVLPVDGRVETLTGNFFTIPMQSAHGGIECASMWNTPNNTYEYSIDPHPEPERLSLGMRRVSTNHPALSTALSAWLRQTLGDELRPLAKARILENEFHTHYTYRLGAPALNRLDAMDDFILQKKEGHCERFAAALALLLRAEGIPARVVVGYVPGNKDLFTGWATVRFRDAHAWTEAWFEGRGWTTLDATPRATTPPDTTPVSDFLEDLDFAWYANIANYDRATQRQVIDDLLGVVGSLGGMTSSVAPLFGILLLVGLGVVWFRQKRAPKSAGGKASQRRVNAARAVASKQYSEMLSLLAGAGFIRQPQQTPEEFLVELETRGTTLVNPVKVVTGWFCLVRYGEIPIETAGEKTAEDALRELRWLLTTSSAPSSPS